MAVPLSRVQQGLQEMVDVQAAPGVPGMLLQDSLGFGRGADGHVPRAAAGAGSGLRSEVNNFE